MKTDKRKDFQGKWTMNTTVELPEMGAEWFLEIITKKGVGDFLITSARVNKRDGYFISHRLFVDYLTNIASTRLRGTEKNVVAQHQAALAQLDSHRASALAHYVIA